jgi:DNA-binding ferritin-like protein
MTKKFNANLLKALESAQDAVENCRQAMVDANDESCRAMYSAIKRDCEKHIQMLKSEIDLHKNQDKWDH